jgi:hypothetical protein
MKQSMNIESKPMKDTNSTDPKYAQGPDANRSCTDIICCIIFVAFNCALIGIAGFAFKNGDPSRLALPYDPDRIRDFVNYFRQSLRSRLPKLPLHLFHHADAIIPLQNHLRGQLPEGHRRLFDLPNQLDRWLVRRHRGRLFGQQREQIRHHLRQQPR